LHIVAVWVCIRERLLLLNKEVYDEKNI